MAGHYHVGKQVLCTDGSHYADAASVEIAAEIVALLDRLEAAERGWQPIETAPKTGQGVLVIDMTAETPEAGAGYWYEEGNVWSAVDPAPGEGVDRETIQAITWAAPTHWRPLPDAPAIDAALVGEG